MKPPKVTETDKMWKLKSVFRMRDAAKTWYFSLKKILEEIGGTRSQLKPSIFVLKEKNKLKGIMVCHVNDLWYGGDFEFKKNVIGRLCKKLIVGSKEKNKFKYIEVQIHDYGKGVVQEQNNYHKTINITDKKLYKEDREMNESEKTEYRSEVEQINWLGQ